MHCCFFCGITLRLVNPALPASRLAWMAIIGFGKHAVVGLMAKTV